ncbi:MAG: chemotaxis protein CheW [Planctomycetota bacterium]
MSGVEALNAFFEGDSLQVVGFRLGTEEFAVPILSVREINQRPSVTSIPHVPAHVAGITNLRGRVIPVVETALHFGMPQNERDRNSERLMVIEVAGRPVGFLVDAVSQVRRIELSQCSSPPTTSSAAKAEFIAGIAKLESHLVILLDPARMIGLDDLPDAEAMGSPVEAAA